MIVTKQEYETMFKEINGMTFTPKANLIEDETEIDGVKEKVFKYEITKTLDEVYQEYLNPQKPQPTQEELLRAKLIKDNASIQLQLAQQQKINASLLSQIAKLGGIK